MKNTAKHVLRMRLKRIELLDKANAYQQRNREIFFAIASALDVGYEAGVRNDPKLQNWPVAFIELPTGQISWHLPQHVKEWDNHTTDEKYKRIAAFNALIDKTVPKSDG